MPTGNLRIGRRSIANHVYLVTTCTASRTLLFLRFDLAYAAARTFGPSADADGAILRAWVLMPDHAHWVIQLGSLAGLPAVVRRMKSVAARAVNASRGSADPVWQRGYHDHGIRKNEDLSAACRYVTANPLRAGIVNRLGDYPFWNAVLLDHE